MAKRTEMKLINNILNWFTTAPLDSLRVLYPQVQKIAKERLRAPSPSGPAATLRAPRKKPASDQTASSEVLFLDRDSASEAGRPRMVA